MEIRNVLVPVDFSPASQLAVKFAVPFARKFRAQLTLLHVVEATAKAGAKDAGTRLYQMLKLLPPDRLGDLHVQTRIRTGSVEGEILAAIDEECVGVVVMGTHYHGLIRRLLVGTLSENMLRKMPVSLLTVSADDHPRSLTRILFATDLTASSQDGFRFALEMARTFGAILIVQHSVEPVPVIDDPANRTLLVELARRKLSALELEGARRQVMVVSDVNEGVAAERILTASEESGSGLVVLTIRYKGLFEGALLGSTAERVVRESRMPVLSFPVNDGLNPIEDKANPPAML